MVSLQLFQYKPEPFAPGGRVSDVFAEGVQVLFDLLPRKAGMGLESCGLGMPRPAAETDTVKGGRTVFKAQDSEFDKDFEFANVKPPLAQGSCLRSLLRFR